MIRRGAFAVAAALAVAGGSGCSENCQSSCTKIYDECKIQIYGVPVEQSQDDCEAQCEEALKQVGEMGSYDPRKRDNPLHPNELLNEKQAAAWMDCVAEATCDELDPSQGICAPI